MLGLSEPTAFPAQLRVVTTWFPGTLRATANSVSVAGGTFGAIIAPPLVAWLALTFNWHAGVHRPGCVGLLVAVLWLRRLSRSAGGHPRAGGGDTADRGASVAFTWPQLWRTRTLWGILLIRFISDPVWYFCLFWLPGYLQENSGLTLAQVGAVGWIPFLAADLGGIASAAWSDRMVRRGAEPLRARKRMLTAMAALAPLCMLTPHLPHPAATLAIFSVVAAACLSWLFSLSVVIAETFPTRNVASVLGIAGGCGAAGAVVFNTFVGDMMRDVRAGRGCLPRWPFASDCGSGVVDDDAEGKAEGVMKIADTACFRRWNGLTPSRWVAARGRPDKRLGVKPLHLVVARDGCRARCAQTAEFRPRAAARFPSMACAPTTCSRRTSMA